MDSILTALKDTPIPTIMVVAGIVFLLLSIAGQLAGRITVPPEQRRQATIMGCLLVVVGVALHVVPLMLNRPTRPEAPPQTAPPPAIKPNEPSQTSTPPPSTRLPPPKPPSQDFNAVPIPSLNARLTALRFFEAHPCEVPPLEQRAYKQRFAKAITLSIFTELTLEHSPSERRLDFMIQAVYQSKPRANGQVIDRPILKTSLPAEEPRSIHWLGTAPGRVEGIEFPCMVMSHLRGQWSVGSYTVDVYINADKVGSSSFEIYE